VIGAGLAAVGITAMLTNDQRLARLNAVVDPANCPKDGSCWQIRHATFALAEGHIVGEGLGNSKEAWNWLSQSESDFIFAIIGEEFGLVGTLTVVLLFGVLTIGLFQVVRHHPSRFAQIAVGAIACWLCAQAIINMGMVVQFLPVIGVPLPFVSSGGSALLASMAAIGAVLGLMRQDPQIGPALRARPRVLGGAGAVTSAGRARRADRQSSACRDARTGRAGRAGRAGRIGRAGRKARRAADTGTGRVPR
jgi:cell division protein FtsW